ncbi:MAG: hypothetical protein ACTSP6_04115, partial [Promethearchaeota archaeon]
MKISTKRKLTLGFLGFLFIFSCVIYNNTIEDTQFNKINKDNHEVSANVKISDSWSNFTHIYIVKDNWTNAYDLGWVSGSGSAGDPYVL